MSVLSNIYQGRSNAVAACFECGARIVAPTAKDVMEAAERARWSEELKQGASTPTTSWTRSKAMMNADDVLRALDGAVFYKATRPDGTDFYTGTVDYAAALASGEPLPELPGDVAFPGPGWYHLATVPTECVGMGWPCRLFEVQPVGSVHTDTDHPHKIGTTSVRVLREVGAHLALGPQGEQVAALIGRCRSLTGDDLDRLYAALDAALVAARVAAWDAAWDAARIAVRVAAQDTAWVAARDAARVSDRVAARVSDRVAARASARDAARDAALGLLCRDLIGQHPGWDQDAYDLLTGPWRDVIGPIHPDDGDEGLGQ